MKITQLQKKLSKYLAEKISLSALHRWFVAAAWDIHLTGSPEVEKIVRQIQHIFDEYRYGDRSEEALRGKLRPFITSTDSE